MEIGWSNDVIPFVSCFDNDLHLDLATSQPLLTAYTPHLAGQRQKSTEVTMLDATQPVAKQELDTNFPTLKQGITKSIRAKFEWMLPGSNAWAQQAQRLEGQGTAGEQNRERRSSNLNHRQEYPQSSGKAQHIQKGVGKPSMASIAKNGEPSKKNNEPFVLQPDKITKIGCCGMKEGRPSLYFSVEDKAFLSEKMGHAIVGKFSHSIPTSSQDQKLLKRISFSKGFSWNYINAKHIIIQFEDVEDYAKMVNGPNGSPVWFIEHHPMRVFKWMPNFDSYFETPIAAVWCNVIAVPIHLFEVSALYAIGSLLGNPILLD